MVTAETSHDAGCLRQKTSTTTAHPLIRHAYLYRSQALGYAEFLKFASDFDLSNSVILSTLEVGDIYLSSIKAVAPDATIRKLTFPEFWEALVRCSLVAYRCAAAARVRWCCGLYPISRRAPYTCSSST